MSWVRLDDTMPDHEKLNEVSAEASECVYFIQAGKTGPIKVGKSSDVRSRIRDFQTGNAEQLRVICELPLCTQGAEGRLHRLLADHRIRGEWFEAEPVLELLRGWAV